MIRQPTCRMQVRQWLGCAIALLSGCGNDATQEADISWTIESRPMVEIRGTADDGSPALSYPSAATRFSDGKIAVADRYESAIRYFDARGTLLHSVGRYGEGPGEFTDITWMGQCAPDTLFVWDSHQGRVSVLDRDGSLIRLYRIPVEPSDPTPTYMTCSSAGTFAFLTLPTQQFDIDLTTGAEPRYHGPLLLADTSGESRIFLSDIPYGEGRPLGRMTTLAVAGDYVFLGTKDSAVVLRYPLAGGAPTPLHLAAEPRAPTRRHFEIAAEEQSAGFRDMAMRRQSVELLLQMAMPETLPLYGKFWDTAGGDVWVVLSAAGDSLTRLQLLRTDGDPQFLTFSGELSILEVGTDYILAAISDSTGAPTVVMHRLNAPVGP